jgi:hypothetical protein
MNILNLYPEDFENQSTWTDICDSLNIAYDTKMVSIDYNVVLTDDDALNIESKYDRKVNDE